MLNRICTLIALLGLAQVVVAQQGRDTDAQAQQNRNQQRSNRERPASRRPAAPAREARSKEGRVVASGFDATDRSLRFEAAVYKLTTSPENAIAIEPAELATQDSLAKFDATLRAFGETQLLYRLDQVVGVDDGRQPEARRRRQKILIAAQQHFVQSKSKNNAGAMRAVIGRENVGSIFTLTGAWPQDATDQGIQLALDIELSAMGPGGVNVGEDVDSPVFRNIEQVFRGQVELGKAFVLLSLDGAAPDENGQAVAFLTRVRMTEP
ncbi:MAG: hypothetical protein ACYTHJ_01585 [Planctomycetota bacterium]